MPFMNGFDAMAEIRRFEGEQGFTSTPIVVLSAYSEIRRFLYQAESLN